MAVRLSEDDREVVEQFRNFLSWGCLPGHLRNVPPCVRAYALGLTHWCPPSGTL